MSARATTGTLQLAAAPYVSSERQKALFGRKLSEVGIIPVLIVVANSGERALVLRRRWVTVAFADGTELNAAKSSAAVDRLLGPEAMEWNQAVGAGGGLDYGFLDLGLSYLFGAALPARARAAEYAKWQFPVDLQLGVGEHHRGFVYFAAPAAVRGSETAVLRVRFASAAQASTSLPQEQVELTLQGLMSASQDAQGPSSG